VLREKQEGVEGGSEFFRGEAGIKNLLIEL
jgi:hypothetical protein